MDTLLPWQHNQVLIALMFEGIKTFIFGAHIPAISGITCCYGYLVTMATEAGAYNIAV